MNCNEFKSELIELARGGSGARAGGHVDFCDDCAAFLEQQMSLTDLERRLDTDESVPGYLEARLLSEFARTRGPGRNRVRGLYRWWLALPAIAGAMVLALVFVWYPAPRRSPQPALVAMAGLAARPTAEIPVTPPLARRRAARVRRAPSENPGGTEGGFLPVPYTQPPEPWERSEIRRMTMPVAALIAAGFPLSASDPEAEANADVLVGEDGRLRAVRLISISERKY
jgi:hypothetical protein